MKVNLQGNDSVTVLVKNAYKPTSSAEDYNCNNVMMALKEQWLIVTQNKRSLQEILMYKF